MRLRYALTLSLLAAAAASAAVALDLNRRLLAGADPLASAGAWHVTVLTALAVLNLAVILLVSACCAAEREGTLRRAREGTMAPSGPRPPREEEGAEPGAGAAVAEARREPEPWGTLARWTPEQARDCFELWQRSCPASGPGWASEWRDFERFFAAAEFDAEGSVVAHAPDGALLGFALALRQPGFEDERYWWLEAPGVLAALVVDPARRRQGIGRGLVRYTEQAARRRRRPRLFLGGLEHFPQLVPGLPAQDYGARLFCLALGYREVRQTCYMEVAVAEFRPPPELAAREKKLAAEGLALAAARAEDAEGFGTFLTQAGLSRPQRRAEKLALDPGCFLLARKEHRLVGFVQVRPKDARGESALDTIFYLKEFRGVGLGSVLLVKAHELWQAQGAARASLWTYPEAAARFYPRAGFRTVQEWVCYVKELAHSWDDAAYVQRFR